MRSVTILSGGTRPTATDLARFPHAWGLFPFGKHEFLEIDPKAIRDQAQGLPTRDGSLGFPIVASLLCHAHARREFGQRKPRRYPMLPNDLT